MEYFTYKTWPYFRVYLKTVNMPKQRVFSACCTPFFLAIHKVFLRKNGLPSTKIPRCRAHFQFLYPPWENAYRYPSVTIIADLLPFVNGYFRLF